MLTPRSAPFNGLGLTVTNQSILPATYAAQLPVVCGFLLGGALFVLCSNKWFRQRRLAGVWVATTISLTSLTLLIIFLIAQICLALRNLDHDLCFTWAHSKCRQNGSSECIFPSSYYDQCQVRQPNPADGSPISNKLFYMLQALLILLCDGLIMYRAFGVVQRLAVRITLFVLWTTLFVIWILCPTSNLLNPNASHLQNILPFVLICCSLVCNAFATGALGVAFWSHKRLLSDQLGANTRIATPVLRIFAILVESGLLLLVIQAAYLATLYNLSSESSLVPTSGVLYIVQAIYTGITGVYPAAVMSVISHISTAYDTPVSVIWTTTPRFMPPVVISSRAWTSNSFVAASVDIPRRTVPKSS